MQLSVSSGKYGILQRANFLTFGDSLDHTTDYPLADMVASANRWAQNVAVRIWRASGTWEWDDANQTDLPIITTTLVAGQQDYSLPTTALSIERVEVKDSSGNYNKLQQIDQSEVSIALSELEETNGMPIFYDIIGNSLFLYPAPAAASVTTTAGLKLVVTREVTTFTVPASYTTADTTQPGFDEMWHDIICYGIAHDYLDVNGPEDRATRYFQKINMSLAELEAHYGIKNRDKRVAFKPRRENLE